MISRSISQFQNSSRSNWRGRRGAGANLSSSCCCSCMYGRRQSRYWQAVVDLPLCDSITLYISVPSIPIHFFDFPLFSSALCFISSPLLFSRESLCLSFKRQLQAMRADERLEKRVCFSSHSLIVHTLVHSPCMSMSWQYCLSFHSSTPVCIRKQVGSLFYTQKVQMSERVNKISLLTNAGEKGIEVC